jgi:DNA-directed RNA polymerase subunit RPC12/RpoP
MLLLSFLLMMGGCSEDKAMQSIETDAHGYICQRCQGKFYTGAKVFLEGKCPKCGQEALADVAGYWCEKDQHMTIRSKIVSSATPVICEKCSAPLRGKMVSPKEKDLVAWGATKTSWPP